MERRRRGVHPVLRRRRLDASLLMIPLVGFLSADDERVVRTVDAIQERLMGHGFVLRYANESGVDGLPTAKECSSRAPSGWSAAYG